MREWNETVTILKDESKWWKVANYPTNMSQIEKAFFWYMR